MRPVINQSFAELISEIRERINRELAALSLPDEPVYLYSPVRYVALGTGKRLRPILVNLVGKEFDADDTDLLNAGLAVEMLHNFTLVHDDIMDGDSMRHGQETVHKHWDESTAILAGDGIYAIAQLLMSQVKTNPLLAVRAFNKATLMVCEGQAYDKEFENDTSISLEKYVLMIRKKTGRLIGLCSELGGILGNQPENRIHCLKLYGIYLGIAFQIQDDILEITAKAEDMGKSLGSDLKAGKQTVLSIMAREKYPELWSEQQHKWSTLPVDAQIIAMHAFIEKYKILDDANGLAREYIDKATAELQKVAPSSQNLKQFTDMVLERKK